MKNIFVEGIQGMGKSTLLRSISAEITELHICWEGDYSPIDLAWCTWMTKEEYDQLLERYEPIREEITKNTVQEDERYIVSYTKIITDIPNFHRDAEKFEIYNGRKSLQELKEIVISRYQKFSKNGYLFECCFFQNNTAFTSSGRFPCLIARINSCRTSSLGINTSCYPCVRHRSV